MVSLTRCDRVQAERQSASLAALAVTLLIVVIGLFLIDTLRAQAAVQDCVLSGRVECEMFVAP